MPQIFNAQRFACRLDHVPTVMRIHERCLALPAFAAAVPGGTGVSVGVRVRGRGCSARVARGAGAGGGRGGVAEAGANQGRWGLRRRTGDPGGRRGKYVPETEKKPLFSSSDVVNFFYDPGRKRYTATWKTHSRRGRAVGIAWSPDGLAWTKPYDGPLFAADDLDLPLHRLRRELRPAARSGSRPRSRSRRPAAGRRPR